MPFADSFLASLLSSALLPLVSIGTATLSASTPTRIKIDPFMSLPCVCGVCFFQHL